MGTSATATASERPIGTQAGRSQSLLVASLLLVVRPGAPSSFLLPRHRKTLQTVVSSLKASAPHLFLAESCSYWVKIKHEPNVVHGIRSFFIFHDLSCWYWRILLPCGASVSSSFCPIPVKATLQGWDETGFRPIVGEMCCKTQGLL